MSWVEISIAVVIIVGILLLVYSRLQGISFVEAWGDILDIIKSTWETDLEI